MRRISYAPLLIPLFPVLAVATPAWADDAAYCAALSEQAVRYLATCAIDNCDSGRTAAGIAVLERKLRNNGFSLPPR